MVSIMICTICHCEIFPVGVSDDYYEDITLHDILFFVASIEKNSPFGL